MAVWAYDGVKWVKEGRRGQYRGLPAFLCCPGPSLRSVPGALQGPGRVIAAINTAYPKVRPDLWFGMDDPECYDSRLLLESFPKYYRGGYQNRPAGAGLLHETPSSFFLDCSGGGVADMFLRREGDIRFVWMKHTLAIALHYLVWAGFREINLVGCDMGGSEDYWHGTPLPDAVRSKNRVLYRQQVGFVKAFAEAAKLHNVSVFSCTENSPLNSFLPYRDLAPTLRGLDAHNVHSLRHASEVETSRRAGVGKVMGTKPVVLHYNSWAVLGGVETTVTDLAKGMPEYQHVLCTRNTRNQDPKFLAWLGALGIAHSFDRVEDVAAAWRPEVIIFHNTTDHEYRGPWKCKMLAAHHCYQTSNTAFDLHWWVSEWVRPKVAQDDGVVSPPPVFPAPFLSVTRPERPVPVVGRVQSATWWRRKSTPLFYESLRKLSGCGLYVVGHGVPEDLRSGDIQLGGMAEHLANIDIMAIWGDTTETWSKATTEASLTGIPVIARNHNDGQAEQLRRSGGGVLVNTITGFVENIQHLVDHADQRKLMGARGRAWCSANATIDGFRRNVWERLMAK